MKTEKPQLSEEQITSECAAKRKARNAAKRSRRAERLTPKQAEAAHKKSNAAKRKRWDRKSK